jgi:hypothetical protein
MHFYHGTTVKIKVIDFDKCRLRSDFGKGFYLNTHLEKAREWAVDKPGLKAKIPTVMCYELKDSIFQDMTISKLIFDAPTLEWLDFVKDNRRKDAKHKPFREPRHNYDIVYGPISDDKVWDVVDRYCKGEITATEAITAARVIPSVFQLSLHTGLALSYINAVSVSQFENDKWSSWEFTMADLDDSQ